MFYSTWMLHRCRVLSIDVWTGTVDQLLFDVDTWQVHQLVVRRRGWLNQRTAHVPISTIRWLNACTGAIVVAEACPSHMTQEHAENHAPEPSPFADTQHSSPAPIPYCGEIGLWASHIYAMTLLEDAEWQPVPYHRQTHRYGTGDVTGYAIAARDRVFGCLEGFLIDDRTWRIVAARINLGPWRFGRCVDLEPQVIRSFDHSSRMATVDQWYDRLVQLPTARPVDDQGSSDLASHSPTGAP